MDEGQFAQMVGITERMACGLKVAIARPAVVYADPLIAWQNANGLQGRRPASGMAGVVGQRRRTRHVRPFQSRARRSRYAQPCLVMVEHCRLAQRCFDLALNAVELLSAVAHQIDQRPHRERRAADLGEELAYARIGDELL
jgi:hypothetical protein